MSKFGKIISEFYSVSDDCKNIESKSDYMEKRVNILSCSGCRHYEKPFFKNMCDSCENYKNFVSVGGYIKPDKMKNLKPLKQYYFERDYFIYSVKHCVPNLLDFIHDNGCDFELENFKIFRSADEFYILHFESGVIINWYKNLGRTNTCNKPISKLEFIRFLQMLQDDINKFMEV